MDFDRFPKCMATLSFPLQYTNTNRYKKVFMPFRNEISGDTIPFNMHICTFNSSGWYPVLPNTTQFSYTLISKPNINNLYKRFMRSQNYRSIFLVFLNQTCRNVSWRRENGAVDFKMQNYKDFTWLLERLKIFRRSLYALVSMLNEMWKRK